MSITEIKDRIAAGETVQIHRKHLQLFWTAINASKGRFECDVSVDGKVVMLGPVGMNRSEGPERSEG